MSTPTVNQIEEDKIYKIANQYWSSSEKTKFDAQVIEDIYNEEIKNNDRNRLMILEFTHYLENYLWPHYNPESATRAHTMSLIFMVNEKHRQSVPIWEPFHTRESTFPSFFRNVLDIGMKISELTFTERVAFIQFFIRCYTSIEDEMLWKQCLKLLSLPLWTVLSEARLQAELDSYPKLKRHWKKLQKKQRDPYESTFLPHLIDDFFQVLNAIPVEGESPLITSQIVYCETFLEFLIDLIAQLPTRRFFNAVVQDLHIYEKCKLSKLSKRKDGRLFMQLLDMFIFYIRFEINDHTGEELDNAEKVRLHSSRLVALQRIAFKFFGEKLRNIALCNLEKIDSRESLMKWFSKLNDQELRSLCEKLRLLPNTDKPNESRELLLEILVTNHEKRISQLEFINHLPLYPTETLLWDEGLIPPSYYDGERTLAIPKLNLQFLTFYDYLVRNFTLFRLESTFEIRQDLEDAIARMNPRFDPISKRLEFKGWQRMAMPIKNFKIVKVEEQKIGENKPPKVFAEISYTLEHTRGKNRVQWEAIRKYDVLFLVAIETQLKPDEPIDMNKPFREQFGVKYIRGCEVVYQSDQDGKQFTGIGDSDVELLGPERTLYVELDPAQYKIDESNGDDVYTSFNLLIRRNPRENNFKAVLETIRKLMNSEVLLPEWLEQIFLGYGDPTSAQYYNIPNRLTSLNMFDTLLDINHVKESFDKDEIKFAQPEDQLLPPYQITFPIKEEDDDEEMEDEETKEILTISSVLKMNRRVYSQIMNSSIRFTPNQVKAILSGMNIGLTLIVGPPGTGKTDVAVQTIANIYNNFRNERTLVVTHSNQGLNDIFEKILLKNVNEGHLVRLGHGEETMFNEKDFTKFGRANYILQRRLELLEQTKKLCKAINAYDYFASSCETAHYLYISQVLAKWEAFKSACEKEKTVETIKREFPFTKFFERELFKGDNFEENYEIAEECFEYIKDFLTELASYRPFELVRSMAERGNYLLTKHARIIAMTCTHAAIKRQDFLNLGFQYDNLIIEEASQILDIETFIPMVLQNSVDGKCRLRRIILIGDHQQLPPIVKNQAIQKYSHLDQSLFARLVRLKVPYIELDYQGRMRKSLAELFKFRYPNLKNLPNTESEEFKLANPGLAFEYQIINVEDYFGKGETTPMPYYYQNLGEAEYAVQLYMYMRLLDYPADKITILTTYNGQKHLILDVLNRRCKHNPVFGMPKKVETVDRYQGQQNDYIILSLVRTRNVGHIRDLRRLVVALSRARLGLYIFCRTSLFKNCYELRPSFDILLKRPTNLCITKNEYYGTTKRLVDDVKDYQEVSGLVEFGKMVYQMAQVKVKEYQERQYAEMKKQRELMEKGEVQKEEDAMEIEEPQEVLEPEEIDYELTGASK